MSEKRFLVLGGCGFIGRNLVHHLVCKYPESKIRVTDKIIPQLAYMNKLHESSFNSIHVQFVSANLMVQESREKVFQNDEPFDYVINCAAETRCGLTDAIYHEGIVELSILCANLAARCGAKRFIEVSCGSVYSKVAGKENDVVEPLTKIAKYKMMVEKKLAKIPGLNYIILRPAFVYGLGDRTSITPRMIIATIYSYLDETMKLFGSSNLMINTVHVEDLCEAICHVLERENTLSQVYNVVDDGCTIQGMISDLLEDMFGISVEYLEKVVTSLCKVAEYTAYFYKVETK